MVLNGWCVAGFVETRGNIRSGFEGFVRFCLFMRNECDKPGVNLQALIASRDRSSFGRELLRC